MLVFERQYRLIFLGFFRENITQRIIVPLGRVTLKCDAGDPGSELWFTAVKHS